VGETRVDLRHLLEDLRDAYAGSLEDTILTEITANALDSGASVVRLVADPAAATLTAIDDGRGMQRRELARYHDVASSTKARGEGIGFAGVGIKLGLLVASEVLTETRRATTHVATRWFLQSRHRAPWKWVPPAGLITGRGTAVRLALTNPLSPLLDVGFIEESIRRHFEPLLDASFDDHLRPHYPSGIAFLVNGEPVRPQPSHPSEQAPIAIRLFRRRKPSAVGRLELHALPLPAERQGVAVSTFGKVIKRGWDWLGVSSVLADRVTGLIEAPELAACLTLNKSDFLRTGGRGAMFLAYRKALQEAVSRQLARWGEARDTTATRVPTIRLERDLERVLADLSRDFPLLDSLVDRRAGGQRRLPLPSRDGNLDGPPLFSVLHVRESAESPAPDDERAGTTLPGGEREGRPGAPTPTDPEPAGAEPPRDPSEDPATGAPGTPSPTTFGGGSEAVHGRTKRRPARYGLSLQFESREDDEEPGRLEESTIWVNDAHPAFRRASESRSLGYHIALSVALALAPLAVTPAVEHAFITRFLAEWGAAAGHAGEKKRRRTARGARR
jgi:hypothetical protein